MKKLYEGNINKNFFMFSFPLIITVFFSQAYGIINTMMSSYLIGEESIAAIGSTAPLISFISSICWGYGSGFSVYIAILVGRGDYKKMTNVIFLNMLISCAFIIFLSILCIGLHEYIFDFLNIEETIRKESFSYFSVYIAGLVLLYISWCGVYISNALGLTKLPLIASVISNILNISLNYIFIKFLGFGVEGTALATIVSALCVSIFYVSTIMKVLIREVGKISRVYYNKADLFYSLSFALPTTMQQSIMYLCTALVSPLTNLCGASAISGYTVGMRIYDVEAGIYQNSNKTISTYMAQCIGANKHSIINKGIKIGLLQTFTILIIFLIPMILNADFVSRLFLDNAESINYSNIFLRFCMPFIFFNVINNTLHAIFRSSGAGKYLVISTFVYAISRFGFSYILFDKYEMYGIFASIVLSWITEALFGGIVFLSGKWKNAEYKAALNNQ